MKKLLIKLIILASLTNPLLGGLMQCEYHSKSTPDVLLSKIYTQGNAPSPPELTVDLQEEEMLTAAENATGLAIQVTGQTDSTYTITLDNCTLDIELTGKLPEAGLSGTLTVLTDGEFSITITLTDDSNYTSKATTFSGTADITVPSITSITPTSDSNLSTDASIKIVFSESMDSTSFSPVDTTEDLIGQSDTASWSTTTYENDTVTISPSDTWDYNSYSFTLNAKDSNGNSMVEQTINYMVVQPIQFAKTASGNGSAELLDVKTDSEGSIYGVGYITGTDLYAFGGTVTAQGTASQGNALLLKYDSTGTIQWAKTVEVGTSPSQFNALAIDSSGNIYTVGTIGQSSPDPYQFGAGVTANGTSTNTNCILVKYNSSGAAQWAQTVTGSTDDSQYTDVVIGSDDKIYASGSINGTTAFDFGGGVSKAGAVATGTNAVLVSFAVDGTAQWASSVSSGSHWSGYNAVAADSSGGIYVAGYITGTDEFNFGNSITATGTNTSTNAVFLKYNTSGVAQLAGTTVVAPGLSSFDAMDVDENNNIYVGGYIYGDSEYTFSNSIKAKGTSAAGKNYVILKYDTSGDAVWAKTMIAGSDSSQICDLICKSNGLFIGGFGSGSGTCYFDVNIGITLTASMNVLFLAELDVDGNFQWAYGLKSNSSDSLANGITYDGSNLFIGGSIKGTGAFDFDYDILLTGSYSDKNILFFDYKP